VREPQSVASGIRIVKTEKQDKGCDEADNSHFNRALSPLRLTNAAERLSRFQTELASEALRRAVDDAGAAMTHQLSEPLTALLFYLHEIRQVAEKSGDAASASASMLGIADMAIREAERVCDTIERAGKAVKTPIDTEAAVVRGREAIEMWTWDSQAGSGNTASEVRLRANTQSLTPREYEVLALIRAGSSNKEGGHQLGISTRTFEAHRAHLMGKLGARNAADLIRKASGYDQ
jgi:DNA-binding CsgD family transcriptional regulator